MRVQLSADVHRRQKQQMHELFDEVAPVYAAADFFSLFGRSLVAWAGLPRTGRLLDLATGRGAVLQHLLPTAEEGSVVAVDLSAQMVVELRRAGAGGAGVRFAVMDAEALGFAGATFDAVYCGFALNMVPRPDLAFREIHRVLRPGGAVAVSIPGPAVHNHCAPYSAVVARFGQLVDPAKWTITELTHPEQVLAATGFTDITKSHDEVAIPVQDPEAFWEMEMAHGMRGFVRALPAAAQRQFRSEVLRVLDPERGVRLVGRGAYFLRGFKNADDDRR